MKEKFREIYDAEQKHHTTRLENLELITTQLKNRVERGQGVLKRNISAEILQTNNIILECCDELLNAWKFDRYTSPYLKCLVENKFDFTDRLVVTKTDPSMCLTEGNYGKIRNESNFVVVTRDSEGLQCYQLDDEIKVDVITPLEGYQLETELKDCKDGKYWVVIKVNGQPLTCSPCVVQARQYQFAFEFGSGGSGAGEFEWINDIAVSDKTWTIAIADAVIKEFNCSVQTESSKRRSNLMVNLSP